MGNKQQNSNQRDQQARHTNDIPPNATGQDKRKGPPPGSSQQQAQEVGPTQDRSRINIETDTDNDDGDRLRDPVSGEESDIERSAR